MKRFFILLVMAAAFFSSNVFAEEEFIYPVGGLIGNVVDEPFVTDELPENDTSGLKAFSQDYDWFENNFWPNYAYVKTIYNEKMTELYERIYTTLYNYAENYSARTVTITNSSQSFTYLLVPAEDLITSELQNIDGTNYIVSNWDDAYQTAFGALEDNPQFYFCNGHLSSCMANNMKYIAIGIEPKYADGNARKAENKKLSDCISDYDAIVDITDSNYTIEKAVHDKMILDNNYEYTESGTASSEHYAHSIVGILDKSYSGAVCEGYSKAYQLLMNRYCVPTRYVAGLASGSGLTNSSGHAWNAVLLNDGEYHCIDVTWDDPDVSNTNYHALYYRFFNTPASLFYTTPYTRDNSITVFPDSLPTFSESSVYYNAVYSASSPSAVGRAENGDYIFPAPTTSDEGAKREVTTAEPVTFTPQKIYPSVEYATEATTSNLQPIAADSPKYIQIKKESGSWRVSSRSDGTKMAVGSGKISFIADENCLVNFTALFSSNAELRVLIDGIPLYDLTISSEYALVTPKGCHKIEFSTDSGSIYLYGLKVSPCGDADSNGTVDLLDAVFLSQQPELIHSNNVILDADSSGIVDDADIGTVLRKTLGISY